MPGPTNHERLQERYGAPRRLRGRLLAGVVAVVVLPLAAIVAWAGWSQATPEVRSELVGFTVEDGSTVTAVVEVRLAERAEDVECVLRALAEDKAAVGEAAFTPTASGRTTVTIRTSRTATAVQKLGCTAAGQPRPR